jgi:transketolase
MGMADIATVLWTRHLRHNPANPQWPNRDRFVLSNGHGSMLLYALLHLTGYDLTLDDLKRFRQLHSRTPGHPELGITLIVFYDDNGISIDGEVDLWFTDDTPKRFEAYGWQVIRAVDGHDAAAIDAAIVQARQSEARPTLICCRTNIGHGSPNKAGSHEVHGAPLGASEILAVRDFLAWPHEPFVLPDDVKHAWDARSRGQADEAAWSR